MTSDGQAVADRLDSASIHLLRVVRAVDARMGLSPARASVLSVLVFGGPRTVGGLARAEGVRSPTMTALVNGLEAAGLARRRSGGNDAREVLVEPTTRARRLLREGQARRLVVLESLLEGLDDDDLAVLDRAAALMEQAVAAQLGQATGA